LIHDMELLDKLSGFEVCPFDSRARWNCENLVLFTEHHGPTDKLTVLSTRGSHWKSWAADNGLL